MVAGLLELELFLPHSRSLKDKRQHVKSLTRQIQSRFHLSVAEVDYQDLWQRSLVGVACVAQDISHAREILSSILRWSEAKWEGDVVGSHLHFFSTKEEF